MDKKLHSLSIYYSVPLIVVVAIFTFLGSERADAARGALHGVARIIDGDTLDVGDTRVRLEGIDAPEAGQKCSRPDGGSWECGRQAARRLRKIIAGDKVRCERRGEDKYGRVLAVCYRNSENLNEEMVQQGFAWAFVRYSDEFTEAEAAARARQVGVWQGQAQAPWEYRKQRWQVAKQTAPKGCAIKGNISNGGQIYHAPWSPWYNRVRIDTSSGERWFCTESEALAAGWRPAKSH